MIKRFQHWLAMRRFLKADRELSGFREAFGAMAMISAMSGNAPSRVVIDAMYKRQDDLIAECRRLGAIVGIDGPYGEPR